MSEEQKHYKRYIQYSDLSDEAKQEFKKALFLSKGAVNNDAGCMLAYIGLSGKDIAKYGVSWKDAIGVDQGKAMPRRIKFPTKEEKITRKRLLQQAARIPDLFDTIRGRTLVAKYGDEIKDELCDESGRCSLNVVAKDVSYEKLLAGVEFQKGTANGYAFESISRIVSAELGLDYHPRNSARLEFLEHVKWSDVVKAKAKALDLSTMYATRMAMPSRASKGLEPNSEVAKDVWAFAKQDTTALANVPTEVFEKHLRYYPGEEEKYAGVFSMSAALGEYLLRRVYSPSDAYGVSSKAMFNSLYIKAMYKAMDEMGVGLATTEYMSRSARGRFPTRVKRMASKVISLNEKYQKMLKNKSNKIEPVILRQTLVGMFNEYADRSLIEYRMFIREDKPAPTLAELHPAKQSKKSAKAKPAKKRSSEPKKVVEAGDAGTFVEY